MVLPDCLAVDQVPSEVKIAFAYAIARNGGLAKFEAYLADKPDAVSASNSREFKLCDGAGTNSSLLTTEDCTKMKGRNLYQCHSTEPKRLRSQFSNTEKSSHSDFNQSGLDCSEFLATAREVLDDFHHSASSFSTNEIKYDPGCHPIRSDAELFSEETQKAIGQVKSTSMRMSCKDLKSEYKYNPRCFDIDLDEPFSNVMNEGCYSGISEVVASSTDSRIPCNISGSEAIESTFDSLAAIELDHEQKFMDRKPFLGPSLGFVPPVTDPFGINEMESDYKVHARNFSISSDRRYRKNTRSCLFQGSYKESLLSKKPTATLPSCIKKHSKPDRQSNRELMLITEKIRKSDDKFWSLPETIKRIRKRAKKIGNSESILEDFSISADEKGSNRNRVLTRSLFWKNAASVIKFFLRQLTANECISAEECGSVLKEFWLLLTYFCCSGLNISLSVRQIAIEIAVYTFKFDLLCRKQYGILKVITDPLVEFCTITFDYFFPVHRGLASFERATKLRSQELPLWVACRNILGMIFDCGTLEVLPLVLKVLDRRISLCTQDLVTFIKKESRKQYKKRILEHLNLSDELTNLRMKANRRLQQLKYNIILE